MNSQFLEAIFVDSIQHPNFFNGRILTAKDLRDEQTANLQRSRYLGQALGSGVVFGLQVSINSADNSALEITGGLAINPKGETLALPVAQTTLKLTITNQLIASSSSPFVPCSPPAANTSTGLITTNYYLLAIASATKFSDTGSAPHSGLGTSNNRCTSRYEEIGVQFKLVPLAETDFVSLIPATALDNRSRLAHVCFGTNELRAIAAQPNNDQLLTYGLIDALYAEQRLTECDVPLAVFQFQSNTLGFVDMWAVRRIALPAQHPQTYLNNPFSFYVSSRRPAEAIAFFLQFQDHLEDLYTDTTLSPDQVSEVVASQYFEYLPAAGYLPIQASSGDRRFRVNSFFEADIPTQSLEPEQLRLLFQDSLYVEPIRPGIDAVDIYQVIGAPTADPYRIFTRRTPISLTLPEAEEEEEEDTPTPMDTGDLYVVVLSTTGGEIAPQYIQSVRAVHQKTGKSYSGKYLRNLPSRPRMFRLNRYRSAVQNAKNQIREKYRSASVSSQPAEVVDDFTTLAPDSGTYFFNDLPAGIYTIKANGFLQNYYGVAESVKITARIDNLAAVVLRKQLSNRPNDLFVGDDYITSEGIIVDGYWINPRWPDYYLEWEQDILGPDFGVIDPPPENWELREDLAVALRLEELLGSIDLDDPRVATADAVIYIHKDYNPAQPGDTITAFVQTQDGSRFPVVPLATDNALDKSASVDRTEIPDFDRATVERLQAVGLAGLDAIASTPTHLLAGILGQSTDYSSSLIADAQTTLQEDFRAGYLGYPGITKTQSDDLKEQFPSKAELANASPDAVAEILGSVSGSFATRFLADVRNTVPQAAFDLGRTGLDAANLEALADIGIASKKAFLDRGATEAGRTELKDTLGVSDVTLDRYLEGATLDFARGELASTPEKSVGTLDNVPPDLKTALARAGIGSVKALANANPEGLATVLGVSLAETTEIINAATPFSSNAHFTLVGLATQGAITAEALTAAGLNSPGAIAHADTITLETIGLDINTAQIIKNLSNQLLSGDITRRFR